jgi:hypothetical protein
MSNTYLATSPYGLAIYGEDVVELDLSATEEKDLLLAGHLEIVPRSYVSTSARYAVPKGETFEAAMLVENEAHLITGGHIMRAEPAPEPVAKKAAAKKTTRNRS